MDQVPDHVSPQGRLGFLRSARLGWVVLLAAVALGLGVILMTGGPKYYSSPSEPREDTSYQEKLAPPEPLPKVDTNLLESATITQSDRRLKIEIAGGHTGRARLLDYTVEPIPSGEMFRWEAGEIGLLAQGIAYGPFPEESQERDAVFRAGTFFDPDGRKMSPEEVESLIPREINRRFLFSGLFPKVRFVFRYPGDAKARLLGLDMFDARTGFEVTGGFGRHIGNDTLQIETDLERWHGGPIKLIMDIAVGPSKTVDIPVEEGSVIHYEDGMLQLAAVHPTGTRSSVSTRTLNSRTTIIFKDRMTDPPSGDRSLFVFLRSPMNHLPPVDFEFYDREGNPINGHSTTSGGWTWTVRADAPPEEIDRIRARIYPNIRRLVFDVPEVYGLPEENYGVENLFAVHIPYFRVNEEWTFRRTVEHLVQMRFHGGTPDFNVPPGYFPKELTDTTPREVLDELRRLATDGEPHRLRIDPDTHTLEIREPLWEEVLSKIRAWLGK